MIFAPHIFTGEADIYVDVNGVKKLNKGGEDLCRYFIDNNGAIYDECESMEDWYVAPVCDADYHEGCSNQEAGYNIVNQ